MSEIRFGVGFPTGREGLNYPVPFCDPDDLVRMAVRAEELGFDSIGGNDHVIPQEYVRDEWDRPPRYYDVFTTLSHVAAETTDLVLNTSVTVLPLRDPVLLAKQAATLDVLSDGRVLLGVGLGAYREEFDAVHPEVSLPRSVIVDESLEALRQLLSGRTTSYDGDHVTFRDVELHPTPEQDPLPICVGGNHPNALERTAKWGQGWLPAGPPPGELVEGRERLRELREKHGRDDEPVDVAPQLTLCIAEDATSAREKFRGSQQFTHLQSLLESTLQDVSREDIEDRCLVGSPDDIVADLQAYTDAGITHFPATVIAANSFEGLLEDMELLSESVLPSFG